MMAAKSNTQRKGDLNQALRKIANKLGKKRALKVGFLEGATYEEERGGKPIAEIAVYQEFGTPNARYPIPPRPFMRGAVNANSGDWAAVVKAGLLNNNFDSTKALQTLGQVIVGQIQESINEGGWDPNAPWTIERKGFDQPLSETSTMRDSVDHKVVDE